MATLLIILIAGAIINAIVLIFPQVRWFASGGNFGQGPAPSQANLTAIRIVSGALLAICVIGAIVIIATGNAG
jgi:hypothetical protein